MSNPVAAHALPDSTASLLSRPEEPAGGLAGTALLFDVIEAMPGAILVYGPDLRVVALNSAFRQLYPLLEPVLRPGVHMREVIVTAIERRMVARDIEDRDAFVAERVEQRRRMGRQPIQRMAHCRGSWIHIRETRSADGCIVCVHTDVTDRKRAEDAQRESEARFRTAFEDASTGMMIATLDGRCVQANRALHEMLGYEAGSLSDVAIADLVHEGQRDEHGRQVQRLLSGEIEHFRSEQRYVGRNGGTVWAIGSASVLRDGAGQPINTIWQLQDVTEHKAAEAALKESEGRLRAIMDASPAAIFLRDDQGHYLLANKAYEQRWGREPGASIGKSVFDLFPRHLAEQYVASDREVRTRGLTAREGKVYLNNGVVRTTLVMKFPLPSADGRPQAVGIISHDITERKQAEEALRASEARLRAIVENSPAAVYLRDKSGRYIVANREFHRRYGLPPGSAIGLKPHDILPAERADKYLELDKTIMASRRSVAHEQVLTQVDGQRHHVLVVKFPIIREDGEVESVGIISTDMTEMRKAEARLRHLQSELTHAYRLNIMGEMATGLAHELNQPLSAIVNYAHGCVRRMQGGVNHADEMIAVMNKIADQAQRAGRIIRWMRGFVRKGGDDKASVDLNCLIRECIEIMDHELERHDIQLSLKLDGRLPPVFADRIQVQQVVLNLIRNGVEALGESQRGERQLTIVSITREHAAEVAVVDNGPGMTAETRARLFDPFYTTKVDGLGMGLSICRTVIEDHGGRLWAEPACSDGSAFRFTLPQCRESVVDMADAGASEAAF